MKKMSKSIALLTLALALALMNLACAEPSAALKGVYDALLAENSLYSKTKTVYAEYYPDAVFEETLRDDGFTIAVTGSEYMDGSWTFTQDGDALTTTLASDDFTGQTMVIYVINAVGGYLGMNTDLINSYVNGLAILGIESDNYSMTEDAASGAIAVRINVAGPWDMKELDEMTLNEASLFFDPLGENPVSSAGSIGKLRVIVNGTAKDVTILLGEYGGLDDLALQSIVNVVRILKPEGWEDFVANYTKLEAAETDGYTVSLDVDDATVKQIIEDAAEGFSYMLAHFGKQA